MVVILQSQLLTDPELKQKYSSINVKARKPKEKSRLNLKNVLFYFGHILPFSKTMQVLIKHVKSYNDDVFSLF